MRTTRLLQNYLVTALPFVLASIIWSSFVPSGHVDGAVSGLLWTVLSFNLILWFTTILVFLTMLVASSRVREMTLARLSCVCPRDEREEFITGQAAKVSYTATLSLLALLLFLSVFSVNIDTLAQPAAGKNHTLSIGIDFNLWAEPLADRSAQTVFGFDGIPLSDEAILLVVLLWQLLFFTSAARRYK